MTPRHAVMTEYISSLIADALTEFTYDADLAGLSYSISSASTGLSITVGGYNEKAHVLLKRVLEKARTLVIDPQRFEVFKEQVPIFVSS
jgi:insulysin